MTKEKPFNGQENIARVSIQTISKWSDKTTGPTDEKYAVDYAKVQTAAVWTE